MGWSTVAGADRNPVGVGVGVPTEGGITALAVDHDEAPAPLSHSKAMRSTLVAILLLAKAVRMFE